MEVAAGAAFLDRWSISEPGAISDDATVNLEQNTQRNRVPSAAERARALAVVANTSMARVYVPSSDEILEMNSRDLGLDL
jgi:hypothetical protein